MSELDADTADLNRRGRVYQCSAGAECGHWQNRGITSGFGENQFDES